MNRKAWTFGAFLLMGGFLAGQHISAQVRNLRGIVPMTSPVDLAGPMTQPMVLAGPDVGFRVVRMDGQVPVGQIVVRIDGVWVTADTVK
jgi:hypothetical protein